MSTFLTAKCVQLSACGNFSFIGTADGRLDMFNMQSGQYRRTFGDDERAHARAITGIAADILNRKVVSTSLDGFVKIWDFHTGSCLFELNLNVSISQICFQAQNNFLAIVSDDLVIRVLDIDTQKIVREFKGQTARFTDLVRTCALISLLNFICISASVLMVVG
jgi:U3 small nucleolar RNA-associated protein 21